MKWTIQKTPRPGDTKTTTEFAWLPTKMSDGINVVWLESYCTTWECVSDYYPVSDKTEVDGSRWVILNKSLPTPPISSHSVSLNTTGGWL